MILIGCFVTSFILVAIVLVFSYAKFHDLLNELKRDVDTQNAQHRKSIDELSKQMDQYDSMLKQLETKLKNFSENKFIDTNKERMASFQGKNERAKRVARSVAKMEATDKMNTHLIKWLFNNQSSMPLISERYRRNLQKVLVPTNKDGISDGKATNILSSVLSKNNRTSSGDLYQRVVDEFLKSNYELAVILNLDKNSVKNGANLDDLVSDLESHISYFEQSLKDEILNEINASLTSVLDKCKCIQNNSIANP